MNGIEFIDEQGQPNGALAERIIGECFKRKMLVLDCGKKDHVLRLIPPLNIAPAEVEEALQILCDSVEASI
jgi:4-aminobutyrate aminotransferase-like enzyme